MNSYKPFKTVSGNFRKNLYKPNLQKLFLVIDLTNYIKRMIMINQILQVILKLKALPQIDKSEKKTEQHKKGKQINEPQAR